MSYIKATEILLKKVIEAIQEYVDGEYIYITRQEDSRKSWEDKTKIKEILENRNQDIYQKYKNVCQSNIYQEYII